MTVIALPVSDQCQTPTGDGEICGYTWRFTPPVGAGSYARIVVCPRCGHRLEVDVWTWGDTRGSGCGQRPLD